MPLGQSVAENKKKIAIAGDFESLFSRAPRAGLRRELRHSLKKNRATDGALYCYGVYFVQENLKDFLAF